MPDDTHRERCYECFRPKDRCFCDAVPTIDNQTHVLILQHARERSHAFNTARIVQKSLVNSQLVHGHVSELASAELPIRPGAGLLYPDASAKLLSDLPADERPSQLVALDGTWRQAKAMFRDIPALHALPRYKLMPETPGRYRIRRELNETTLSTLEAIVGALRLIEPDTAGLAQLLAAFETMIERQLPHPRSKAGGRRNERRRRIGTNIPRTLIGDLSEVVVAYGESAPSQRKGRRSSRKPIYWVAERLQTGERFAAMLEPSEPLSDAMLGHLELTSADFENVLSDDQFREAWADFLQEGDTLVTYHPSSIQLLESIEAEVPQNVVLKSVSFGARPAAGSLEERLVSEGLAAAPAELPGRAGRRLAQTIALVRHLNALGNKAMCEQ